MTFHRRQVLAGAAGMALLPLAPSPASAAPRHDFGSASVFRDRLAGFLAALPPDLAAEARFPLEGRVHRGWNFMGAGGFIKPGARLEQMDAPTKDRAWDALAALFSPRGIEKTRDVMTLQAVLTEMGGAGRSPERFSFAVFGDPAPRGRFAFRLEGHHLSVTATVEDDRLVGVTPSSFSVNPNRVGAGRHAGLVTLKREDDLARRLAGDLDGAVRRAAFFRDEPFRNVLALAGREDRFAEREGAPVADLTAAQRDLVREILDAYAAEHLAEPYAGAMRARLAAIEAAGLHFAYAGSVRVGEPAYYRFTGDGLAIEFASVDRAAQHLHTVFHLL
jgi:hypothetical protein